MTINVGSLNQTKIDAVKHLLAGHKLFPDAVIKPVAVEVEEFGHPKTLEETVNGAKQRAKLAFRDCDYSVGIENGLMKVAAARSGYFETTVCSIYDGHNYYLGMAPAFEWPAEMVKLILAGYDGSQAFKKMGLTEHAKIGAAEGGIHILTKGKINRTRLNELAVMMALIHLENPHYYTAN